MREIFAELQGNGYGIEFSLRANGELDIAVFDEGLSDEPQVYTFSPRAVAKFGRAVALKQVELFDQLADRLPDTIEP